MGRDHKIGFRHKCLHALLVFLVSAGLISFLLAISDWIIFDIDSSDAPLDEDSVPRTATKYEVREDRSGMAGSFRTSYDARDAAGNRVLFFQGHMMSPRSKTTALGFAPEDGSEEDVAKFTLRKAGLPYLSIRPTYRVYGTDGRLRFTISKGIWGGKCRLMGIFDCRPEWYVYRGWIGSDIAYYAVGEEADEIEDPHFKFYRSKRESLDAHLAKLNHQRRLHDEEDVFKVKVEAGEDAALILATTTVIDRWADSARHRPTRGTGP